MQMRVDYSWLENTKNQLLDIIKHNVHALMLCGNPGIGKKSLSLWLAKILLCENSGFNESIIKNSCNTCSACHLFDIFQHPDLYILDYQNEKNTQTNLIGIDNIHNLINSLQQTPHMGKMQVVIIYVIEHLTQSAANALLKTLEEPNNKTIFILISHNIKKVLPTILSRCINLNIASPNKQQGIAWINENNPNLVKSIKNLFADKPLLTKNYDESIYNNTIEFLTNPYTAELKIDSKKTQQIQQILNICIYWLFDLLYYIYTSETKFFTEISKMNLLKKYSSNAKNINHALSDVSIENIYACWEYLIEISQYNNFNLNNKLILNMFSYKYQDIFKKNYYKK